MNTLRDNLPQAVDAIRSQWGATPPEVGLVLGSGLGSLVNLVSNSRSIPYTEIPGFVASTVQGHAGRLVYGQLGGKCVVIMQGRLHFYEGYSMEQITFPYRLLKRLGIKSLVLTSAVGGISDKLKPGSLMLVRDHINFMGENPLRGPHYPENGQRFPDMTETYSPVLRAIAKKAAKSLNTRVAEGIYCAVRGPSYETPMEIKVFKKWGADVVGMSVIPESIVSHQEGVGVLAIACITNKAAGISGKPLSHEEVMETGKRVESTLAGLVKKIVELI